MAIVLAPWLKPADVIGSASAGANLGLAARARDLQEAAQAQEAEQFIAKLNQQASEFDRHLKVQQDIATSRLAQALRAQDALDAYRKEQTRLGHERLAADALRQDALDAYRREQLDVTKSGHEATAAYRNRRLEQFDRQLNSPSKLFENNPDVIIAKSALSNAKDDDAKRASAEQQLRQALATPAQRAEAAEAFKNIVAHDALQAQSMRGTNAPAAEEKVIVIKDGKRFRLPKSQLDEALSEGYKLWQ